MTNEEIVKEFGIVIFQDHSVLFNHSLENGAKRPLLQKIKGKLYKKVRNPKEWGVEVISAD
jgi:hypothetical protein